MARIGVIGAGVIGMAVAAEYTRRGSTVTVFDKEAGLARHQTGRNSGVAHSGIYYLPGSLKATLCRRGVELLKPYCESRGVAYEECGKVIVASSDEERARLGDIFDRGTANGVPGIRLIEQAELRAIEPHARGVAAVHSPTTAIVDFGGFVHALASDVADRGGTVRLGSRVVGIDEHRSGVTVTTSDGAAEHFDFVVACAGLHADRVAALAGAPEDPRIIPFRGEYFRLAPGRQHLVNGLIYPVPDPRYPFLGIHLTRTVTGDVLVGPNAVLALAQEGYRWRDVDARDLWHTVSWPGFRRLARQNLRTGAEEVARSLSRRAFLASARRYVPELQRGDLVRARAGVRAQAVGIDGTMVDDFRFDASERVLHLRNAPSPAATSSLAIAERVVQELDGLR
ncbi:MAG: L-2-hydroxyglutarate oxidase [Microthrixaceae bacterium]